jgi:L-iditol 2-dehydrogenase
MKALVNTGPGQVQWQDWPTPQPGRGQVRIRTCACGICATDLEMIRGWSRTSFPAIPGHEWSGIVDAAGLGVEETLVGQPCVAENILSDGGEVGFEHPGGYGQYLLTEERNVHPLPAGFPFHVAALIEPLAVCVRAIRRLRLENRRSALVLGDGPIGLLMLALLKRRQVQRLVLAGGRPERLELGRRLGADVTVNYHEAGMDLAKAVAASAGSDFPNIIEASGSSAAMKACLELAGKEGKVLVIGDYGSGRAEFPWNRLLHREWELIGSSASAEAWAEAVTLAVTGAVPLEKLITHRLPASSFAEAIELVRGSRDVVKVVVEWTA